jgi:hypothetical protein
VLRIDREGTAVPFLTEHELPDRLRGAMARSDEDAEVAVAQARSLADAGTPAAAGTPATAGTPQASGLAPPAAAGGEAALTPEQAQRLEQLMAVVPGTDRDTALVLLRDSNWIVDAAAGLLLD